MAPWVVVVCTTAAVALPLIVGWWYSELRLRRELRDWMTRVDRLHKQVHVLNSDLARATLRASAVLKALGGDESTDLGTSITGLHHQLQVRTLALNALRRKHAKVLRELSELRSEVRALRPGGANQLSENQDFQLLLAQVTDERDRLKGALEAHGERAQRKQILELREEVDELRFQLRIANRAIVELEQEKDQAARELGLAEEITAPIMRVV